MTNFGGDAQDLEWALAHRNHFDSKVWGWRVHNLQEYVVRTLGAVGSDNSRHAPSLR